MMLNVEEVSNGYILSDSDDDSVESKIVFDVTNGEMECVVDLLNTIKYQLGFAGSKHDARRIVITIENQVA